MRCPKCGDVWPDDMKYCPKCSTPLVVESLAEKDVPTRQDSAQVVSNTSRLDTTSSSESHTETIPIDQSKDRQTSEDNHPRSRKTLLLVIAVIAVVAVVVLALSSLNGGAGFEDPSKVITEDMALEGYSEGSLPSETLTSSEWGSNGGYKVVSSQLDKVDSGDVQNGSGKTHAYNAHITVVYENDSFKVTETRTVVFNAKSKEKIDDTGSASIEPKAVSDQAMLDNIDTILQAAKSSKSHSESLSSIYSDPTGFKVTKNDTDGNGGTAEISISRIAGLKTYSGTVTAKFSWSDSTGDWSFESASVDDTAWKPSYDELKGTWTGELSSTDIMWAAHNCYGAKVRPLTITITDVMSTGQIKLNFDGTYHNHASAENSDEDSDPADIEVSLNDISATIDEDGEFSFKSEEGEGAMSVEVAAAESDGNKQQLTATVTSATNLGGFEDDRFTDTFVLTKTS